MAPLTQRTSHKGSSVGQLAHIPTNCLKVSQYRATLTTCSATVNKLVKHVTSTRKSFDCTDAKLGT